MSPGLTSCCPLWIRSEHLRSVGSLQPVEEITLVLAFSYNLLLVSHQVETLSLEEQSQSPTLSGNWKELTLLYLRNLGVLNLIVARPNSPRGACRKCMTNSKERLYSNRRTWQCKNSLNTALIPPVHLMSLRN